MDVNFMVGGEAGQGVQSVGFLLAKIFHRGGHYVFADQDYESRVRGGHNFFRVRVTDKQVTAASERVDFIIALNRETIELHEKEVAVGGVIICDTEEMKDFRASRMVVEVPMQRLAEEKTGNKVMANTVGLGAALGLVGYDLNSALDVLREYFGGKVGEDNAKAARAGYDVVAAEAGKQGNARIQRGAKQTRLLMTGNEAIGAGAVAAGCKFMSAYPMTPTTSIMEYLADKDRKTGVAVVQLEDEIAVINAVVGAAYAGVRAMTATSGGGFCLMVEGLSLAGMTETPVVVVLGQRPGPAIGLPTRTEQGELEFAIHSGHGEFPRAVLAPADAQEAFWLTAKAFNIAEKYQSPVIIMTDHVIGTSYFSTEKPDLSKITIDRGVLYAGNPPAAEYKRYKVTASGISPRAFPMQAEGLLVAADSDEHGEEGHIIEDAATRNTMMRKRMKKLDGIRSETLPPIRYGSDKAEITLMGWGSTRGPIWEAVDQLRNDGMDVNALHFPQVWPFPIEATLKAIDTSRKTYVVENNITSQFSHLMKAETGQSVTGKVLRYDGRPFTAAFITEAVKKGGRL